MPRIVDSDERRTTLATAAAQLISRGGIGAATMRNVAAEAGLTTGALTHYFRDKQDLLRFTLEASLEGRRLRVRPTSEDPLVELRETLAGSMPIDRDTRLHWIVTIAFAAQVGDDAELGALQRDAYRGFRRRIAILVERGGLATGDHALAEAEQLIAIMDGIAVQAVFDQASWPPARQLAAFDVAFDRWLTGVGRSPVAAAGRPGHVDLPLGHDGGRGAAEGDDGAVVPAGPRGGRP